MPIQTPNKLGRTGITPAASPSPLAIPDFTGVGERINRSVQPSGLGDVLSQLTGVAAPIFKQFEDVRKEDERNVGLSKAGSDVRETKTPAELAARLRKTLADSTLSPEFRVAYRELAAGELATRYDVAVQTEMEAAVKAFSTPDPKTGLFPDPPDATAIQNKVWQDVVGGADAATLKSVFFRGALEANAAASNTKTAKAYEDSVRNVREKNAETLFASAASTHFAKTAALLSEKKPDGSAYTVAEVGGEISKLVAEYADQAYRDGFRNPRSATFAGLKPFLMEMGRKNPEGALEVLDQVDETVIAGVALKNDPNVADHLDALRGSLEAEQRRQEQDGVVSSEKISTAAKMKAKTIIGTSDLANDNAAYLAAEKAIKESDEFATAAERNIALEELRSQRHNQRIYANADKPALRASAERTVQSMMSRGHLDAARAFVDGGNLPDDIKVPLLDLIDKTRAASDRAGLGEGSLTARTAASLTALLPTTYGANNRAQIENVLNEYTEYQKALTLGLDSEALKPFKARFDAAQAEGKRLLDGVTVRRGEVFSALNDLNVDLSGDIVKDADEMMPAQLEQARRRRDSAVSSAARPVAKALQDLEAFTERAIREEDKAEPAAELLANIGDLPARWAARLNDLQAPGNGDKYKTTKAELDKLTAEIASKQDEWYKLWHSAAPVPKEPLFKADALKPFAVTAEQATAYKYATTYSEAPDPNDPVWVKLAEGEDAIDLDGWFEPTNDPKETNAAYKQLRAGDPRKLQEDSRRAWARLSQAAAEDPLKLAASTAWAIQGRYIPIGSFLKGSVGDAPNSVPLDPKNSVVANALHFGRTPLWTSRDALLSFEAAYAADDPQAVEQMDALLKFKGWDNATDKGRIAGGIFQAQRALLGLPEGTTAPTKAASTEGASAPAAETQPTAESKPTEVVKTPEAPTAAAPVVSYRKEGPDYYPAFNDRAEKVWVKKGYRPDGSEVPQLSFPSLDEIAAASARMGNKVLSFTAPLTGAPQPKPKDSAGPDAAATPPVDADAGRIFPGLPVPRTFAEEFRSAFTPTASSDAAVLKRRSEAYASTVSILQESETAGVRMLEVLSLRAYDPRAPKRVRWHPTVSHVSLTPAQLEYFRRLNALREVFDE